MIVANRRDSANGKLAIEVQAYTFPWTRGNFENSVKAGHLGMTLRDPAGALAAYAVLMPVVDEMHLLNITVDPARQRTGLWGCSTPTAVQRRKQPRPSPRNVGNGAGGNLRDVQGN